MARASQAARGLNTAYQNFYTAVEINAALSLSLRVLVRARNSCGPHRRRSDAPPRARPVQWSGREYSSSGAFEQPSDVMVSGRPDCAMIPKSTRRYPIRVRRDPDRELFRLLELLPHCALREHPRELPGCREVRLSLANATSHHLSHPGDGRISESEEWEQPRRSRADRCDLVTRHLASLRKGRFGFGDADRLEQKAIHDGLDHVNRTRGDQGDRTGATNDASLLAGSIA